MTFFSANPTKKKVEFMHSIGMTHDNAQEILNMGDILMQSGYSKEAYDLLTVPPAWETLRHQLEKERA